MLSLYEMTTDDGINLLENVGNFYHLYLISCCEGGRNQNIMSSLK